MRHSSSAANGFCTRSRTPQPLAGILVLRPQVAGGEDDRHIGARRTEPRGELEAGHAGHRRVRDDHVEFPRAQLELLKRLRGVREAGHVPAETRERAAGHEDEGPLVVDVQDTAAPRGHCPGSRSRRGFDRDLDRRKENVKRRSLSRLALDPDRAAVAPHDPVRDRKPEPAALPWRHCREEGIEDAFEGGAIHAMAVVDHRKPDITSAAQVRRRAFRPGVHVDGRDPELDVPRAHADRVRRVRGEIHDDLMDLRGIPDEGRHVRGEVPSDVDRRRQGGSDELERVLHDEPEVEDLALLLLRPAEGQNPADELRGPCARLRDLGETLQRGMAGRKVGDREARVAGDREQDVVEVVGDASGERAERLELLCPLQGFLRELALGDVEQNAVPENTALIYLTNQPGDPTLRV